MTRWTLSPTAVPLAAVLVGLLSAMLVLFLALGQPWLGLRLTGTENGVILDRVHPDGPAAQAGLTAGAGLATLGPETPEPGDLLEEPDMLPSFAAYDRFIERQVALAQALRDPGGVVLGLEGGRSVTVQPADWRPIWTLPVAFWAQLVTGLFGFWLGGWVLGTRRGGKAEWFLFLAGAGLLLSALAAAVYSTRELALPGGLFRVLSATNHLGALLFGAGMIGLFLVYPVRLVRRRWLWPGPVLLLLWWTANQMRLLPDPATGFQLPVALALLAIAVCIACQYRATRHDPRARAALRWFGLSVLTGAGAFVLTVIVPVLLGLEAALPQGLAFLFFLPIYGGLALGVMRYRLFDLDDWSFRILFYMGAVVALVVLDAGLIAIVALDRAPAFGLSLLVVALLYLPLRDGLARRMLRRAGRGEVAVFRAVADVALTPPGQSRVERWHAMLREEFDPLTIAPDLSPVSQPALAEDGAVLRLPPVDTLPGVVMTWARGGRALFSTAELGRAQDIVTMLAETAASRRAYEQGVTEERARIAQDMHDNIGIQLMGALHSPSVERKDVLIRETLGDLRDIISNANRGDLPLQDLLADLRASLGEHLSSAGITLDWTTHGEADATLTPRHAHAVRSILREATGNALRHSGADRIGVEVSVAGKQLSLSVRDNGRGFDPEAPGPTGQGNGGNGLSNMRVRATGLGGRVSVVSQPNGGTEVRADLPLAPPTPRDAR